MSNGNGNGSGTLMPAQSQQHHPYPPPPYHFPNNAMPPAPMNANMPANGQNGVLRFPIPPAMDARQMTGGRHKKEIKRRTKTGCLTCRKRRIKVRDATRA
jgi:hypothetical protein